MENARSGLGEFIRDITSPDGHRLTFPAPVNAHTHCADSGVRAEKGMTLEQLVAPPNGLKHRYLRDTPDDVLIADIGRYQEGSARNGISRFVDFREGGIRGCRIVRKATDRAFVMGRPEGPVFDTAETDEILDMADGIALSSLSDVDPAFADACSRAARRAGKPFAIHASERKPEDIEQVLALEPSFLVHLTGASDSDLRAVADAGVPVAVCPRSNAFYGMVTPVDRMLDAGIDLAFGTDNAMLCSPDLRPEVLLAAEILGSRGHDPLEAVRILVEGSARFSEVLGIRPADDVSLPFDGKDPLGAFRIVV